MTGKNPTWNQHFVTQAEQRLNSSIPAARASDQRIYAFSLVDRDPPKIHLTNRRGRKITSTLSFNDLFSFDVLDRTNRYNFEQMFQRYEEEITRHSFGLIDKIKRRESAVKEELVRVFLLKLLNSFRNPYSVQRTLNTFPAILKNVHPTDPVQYQEYERVVFGNRPHEETLCRHFGITAVQYRDWLRSLFILLHLPDGASLTLFDQVVASLFNDGNLHVGMRLCTYDTGTCLLPDNGFVNWSDHPGRMVMAFNLHSRAFLQCAFVNIDAFVEEEFGPIPQRYREALEQHKSGPKRVTIHHDHNDLQSLQTYNANAVLQCHSHVYSAAKKCCGVQVEMNCGAEDPFAS